MILRILAERCTDTLIKHDAIQAAQRPVFRYGFELFWSTFLCIVSICVLGGVGGYMPLAITFILYFMPIRTAVGGYHAKSYGRCFLLTNIISLVCVTSAGILSNWGKAGIFVWTLYGLAVWYIWINAPVKSRKNFQREETLLRRKRIGRKIVCMESLSIALLYMMNYKKISYMAIVTSWAVAVMMFICRKEEKGND